MAGFHLNSLNSLISLYYAISYMYRNKFTWLCLFIASDSRLMTVFQQKYTHLSLQKSVTNLYIIIVDLVEHTLDFKL